MTDIKEQIKKINWHVFHKRSRSPFLQLFLLGAGIQKEGIPFDNRVKHLGIFLDIVIVDESEKSRLRDVVIKHLQKEPEFLLKLMERAYREHAEAIKLWTATKDYDKMSNEQLAQELKNYADTLLSFGIYATLPLFVEEYLEQTLLTAFTKRYGNEAQAKFNTAVTPVKDATVIEEELALLELMDTPDKLAEHAKNYGWMANVGYFEDYFDIEHYRSRLEELKKKGTKREDIIAQREKHRKDFKELLKELADDPYLVTMTKTTNEAVFFRSYRTEMYYGSPRYLTGLFKEIAKRIGLDNYKDFVWLFWKEIHDALLAGKKADTKRIADRKQCYCFLTDNDNKYYLWEGKEAQEIHKAFDASQEIKPGQVSEIKGQPAFPGKMQGKAVVVTSADQMNKVQEGDILIAHATNVNYVPILKKVIAMVTEEGGILSHASIISREMRIPCVIGTKIATKVVKDGDQVEVDAENGIVKLIKNS